MNKLDALSSRMYPRVIAFLEDLNELGVPYAILETYRPQSTQDAYYAQGREPLAKVNALREQAGLGPINEATNKQIITRAKVSFHTSREAIDIIPTKPNGGWNWDTKSPEAMAKWLVVGECGERHGLRWGGRWDAEPPSKLGWDCPHFEFDPKWVAPSSGGGIKAHEDEHVL